MGGGGVVGGCSNGGGVGSGVGGGGGGGDGGGGEGREGGSYSQEQDTMRLSKVRGSDEPPLTFAESLPETATPAPGRPSGEDKLNI